MEMLLPAAGMLADALPDGTRLERYELRSVIGQGGGGITYLAVDCELKREVVLKEHFPMGLCRRVSGSAQVEALDAGLYNRSLQTFCREARILAGLKHAGIVPVHEIFRACGTAFLVMDYVEGETLREWMRGRPGGGRTGKVLQALLATLQYLHEAGVVHRDIKPDNILVQEDDKPILIDFGAAMLGEPTHTLTLVGTPSYAAPEQFDASVVPGPQTDIYALGRSIMRVAADCGVVLPGRIRHTLRRACAEQPEKRYRSADEWRRKLKPVISLRVTAGVMGVCAALAGVVWLVFLQGPVRLPGTEAEPLPPQNDAVSTKPVAQTTSAPEASGEPLPQDAPAYHPIQLVKYDNSGNLCYAGYEKLPPAERAFVEEILRAQEQCNEMFHTLEEDYVAGKIKSRKYYSALYREQKQLNEKVVSLILAFIDRHYRGKDPQALWTPLLLEKVRSAGLHVLEPLMKHHVTHPRHLVAYNDKGELEPLFRRGTENERIFVTALQRLQQQYHHALQQAEKEAEDNSQPLSATQRRELACQLQSQLNEKVLQEVDHYIEQYEIDETHPEYACNATLREEVRNKNIPPEF